MTGAAALLVDLDGTLVATADANFDAYAAALAEIGVHVARADFDAVAQGRNWKQFLPPLLEAAGSAHDPAAIAARKATLYPAQLGNTVVNAALVRLLELSRPRCRTALVTTASRPNAEAILRHHDLARLFDLVITGSDVARHKPDPEAYHLAARRLGVAPQDCVVFEDSDIGVASAQAFGAPVMRVRID